MVYSFPFSYWAWFATIYLIILTYQDYKHNMLVDDRHNWFMYGMTISLVSHIHNKLWYVFVLLGIVLLFGFLMRKYKLLGDADVNSLGWILYGFGIISIAYYVAFAIILILAVAFVTLLKNKVFKYKAPIPFYAVLLIIYVGACLILGIY